jgi:hypothetical protein
MIGDAIDRGRGDVNNAAYPAVKRGLKNGTGANDISCVDVVRGVERQGGSAMHDRIGTFQGPVDISPVTDVSRDNPDATNHVLVIERGDIKGYCFDALVEEISNQIDAEKSGAAGNQNACGAKRRFGQDVVQVLRASYGRLPGSLF